MTVVGKLKWTNESVLLSSPPDVNPVEYIEDKARKVVLDAIDSGWSGPPFDPIKLAKNLGMEVVPNSAISDARTLINKEEKFVIEFNPNKPRGRIRFSIAHEIVHTLFDDCAKKIRNREVIAELSDDTWQLEMLCNIGAAEIIMPIGSYNNFLSKKLKIQDILELRKEFDVSTEAILIRYAKQTRLNLAMFCASRIEKGKSEGKYKIDYLVPSKAWDEKLIVNKNLDDSSIISDCTAIGYVAEGDFRLSDSNSGYIEAVGLPPYPGCKFPRVAGIISVDNEIRINKTPIRYHQGDATEPGGRGKKIIAHIVNDATPNWGGGGFAVSLKRKHPEVQIKFKEWASSFRDQFKLGNTFLIKVNDDLRVLNMVAQRGYGKSEHPRIRYAALRSGLDRLLEIAVEQKATIHMPRIGVGNAGGKWEIIEELINEVLIKNGIEVNIYNFENDSKTANLNIIPAA